MTLADLVNAHWASCYALALFAVFWVPLVFCAGTGARAKRGL